MSVRVAWLRACEALTRGAAVELPLTTNLTAATKAAAAVLAAVLAKCRDRNDGSGVSTIARFLHGGRCRGVAAQSICIDHPAGGGSNIAVTRDGSRLFVVTDGCITVFDLHALAPLYTIDGGRTGFTDMFVAEDGALFAAELDCVLVFEPGARRNKHCLRPHQFARYWNDFLEIQAVCADAALVAIGMCGLRVILYSRETYSFQRIVELPMRKNSGYVLSSMDFLERDSKLAVSNEFFIAVFNLHSGALLWTVDFHAIGSPGRLICRDGAVYVACERSICVLDAAGGVRHTWGHTQQRLCGFPDCRYVHAPYFAVALDDNGVLYARGSKRGVVATFV